MSAELEFERPTHCRSCGAPISWAQTSTGKWMPIDRARDDKRANLIVREGLVQVVARGQGEHRPHFSSCPDAGKWRRR